MKSSFVPGLMKHPKITDV